MNLMEPTIRHFDVHVIVQCVGRMDTVSSASIAPWCVSTTSNAANTWSA